MISAIHADVFNIVVCAKHLIIYAIYTHPHDEKDCCRCTIAVCNYIIVLANTNTRSDSHRQQILKAFIPVVFLHLAMKQAGQLCHCYLLIWTGEACQVCSGTRLPLKSKCSASWRFLLSVLLNMGFF